MKQDKNLLPYFPSGNIISVPVNQRVCKNCNNFKQNSHSNYKQEKHGAASYRKIYFTKDWFQEALSRSKKKNCENSQKFSGKKTYTKHLKLSSIVFLCQEYFGSSKAANLLIFEMLTKTNKLI